MEECEEGRESWCKLLQMCMSYRRREERGGVRRRERCMGRRREERGGVSTVGGRGVWVRRREERGGASRRTEL